MNNADAEPVTILVKDPSKEWVHPAEVYDTPEQAEAAAEERGFDLSKMRSNARLIRDVPLYREADDD